MSKYKVNNIQDIFEVANKENIPLEEIRFFIGKDEKSPKAFGIFQNSDGKWIVYKNKSDGTRAIRYEGDSESEACQIIMDKIEEETRNQKKRHDFWQHEELLIENEKAMERQNREYVQDTDLNTHHGVFSSFFKNLLKTGIIASISLFAVRGVANVVQNLNINKPEQIVETTRPQDGYYHHDNDWYYYRYPFWYILLDDTWQRDYNYDNYDSYYDNYTYTTPEEYYDGGYYEGDFKPFEYTNNYSNSNDSYTNNYYHDSDDDYYYDSDWSSWWDSEWDSSDSFDFDYDDWDSSYTDWDSDW